MNEIVSKPLIMITGIECRTSNHIDAGPVDIPELWARFYSEDIFNKITNKASEEIIALYCDYEGDYMQPYSLIIGCHVNSLENIPAGLVGKTIPAASYAFFRAIGEHPRALVETWGEIWQTDLKRTYTGDYEVYGEKFLTREPKEVEIFIAIE